LDRRPRTNERSPFDEWRRTRPIRESGSCRSGFSLRRKRHFELVCSPRGVCKRLGNVVIFEVWVEPKNFIARMTGRDQANHGADRYAEIADARTPAHPQRVCCDASQGLHGRMSIRQARSGRPLETDDQALQCRFSTMLLAVRRVRRSRCAAPRWHDAHEAVHVLVSCESGRAASQVRTEKRSPSLTGRTSRTSSVTRACVRRRRDHQRCER